ncbi:hypothetical protein ACHHYP_01619 [Achlya hypogyna]|uniref:dolichyl-phosphate-mannose--protein mannosyltransferase n=1 Tax=Achlya hypogyna TaxID=1202772 RepID=A0A1V9Z867_ACHHY|nr:hypothetical protein ACHHYP_01619 [Achlya hypogyna]
MVADEKVVGVVAAVVFWNSLGNGFAWDDRGSILTNADVRSDATPVTNLLTHDFWGADLQLPLSHKSYRPATVLSFRWNYAVGGLDPRGFHAVNIALHACAAFLLVRVGRRLASVFPGTTSHGPLLGGLLFAVHPVHCDSVASIVGRADVLCTVFSLLAILAYVPPLAPRKLLPARMATALLLALFATLSKETGATTFGLFVVFEVALPGTTSRLRVAAVCAATALLVLVRIAINGPHTLYAWTKFENEFAAMPWGSAKGLTIAHLHGWYLYKLVWPRYLCYDYGYRTILPIESFGDGRNVLTFGAYLVVLVIGGATWRARTQSPAMLYAALALLPFVPAANVLFPIGTVLAERLLYFPSAGFCLLVGAGVDAVVASVATPAWCRRLVLGCFLAILAVGGLRAMARNTEWTSEATLFEASLMVAPESVKVLTNVAKQHLFSNPPRATSYLERAVALMPEYSLAHLNLAAAYGSFDHAFGKPLHSMQHLVHACALDQSSLAFSSLGMRLVEFVIRHGAAVAPHCKQTILARAETFVESALAATPLIPSAYYTLGQIALQRGDPDGAIRWFERTVVANEQVRARGFDLSDQMNLCHLNTIAHNCILHILFLGNRLTSEVPSTCFEVANNAAMHLHRQNATDAAVALLKKALAVAPTNEVLRANLATVARA